MTMKVITITVWDSGRNQDVGKAKAFDPRPSDPTPCTCKIKWKQFVWITTIVMLMNIEQCSDHHDDADDDHLPSSARLSVMSRISSCVTVPAGLDLEKRDDHINVFLTNIVNT